MKEGDYMKYYSERNGLLDNGYNMDLNTLREYFYKIYKYFNDKHCFDVAEKGVWKKLSRWEEEEKQIISPLMNPSPEIFFLNALHSSDIYPIYQYYEYYTEDQLFTVIEILYDKIAEYDYEHQILKTDVKKMFVEQINNILKFYSDGYYLEQNSGTITVNVNSPIKNMFSEDLATVLPDDVMSKMKAAIKLYYRFDSTKEFKRKGISTLADILEPLRKQLKSILNSEYEVNKDDHDKLIFEIVNNFDIRHNNLKQNKNYDSDIWYDWMMQYYSSVIITYYKLIKETE